jgi:dTDP-glucose 4,6-dehydratase
VVLRRGQPGEIYSLGTGIETTNIEMTRLVLKLLNKPESLIQPITDRPGHDRRYALDCNKIQALGWRSAHNFEQAIEATVKWYVDNEGWWRKIKGGQRYQEYYQRQYAGREISR